MKILIDKQKISTLDELRNYVPFGSSCQLCIPYVELVLKTGKTEFLPADFGGGPDE